MNDDIYLKKPGRKKKKKVSGFVIEEEGEHPVHEEYTKEEPWKE